MCIIVFKPANVEFPSLDTLKQCFESNSDGAGVAIKWKNEAGKTQCFIRKGFMTWRAFKKYFTNTVAKYVKNDVILHFRIGTHGQKSPGNCHPFPISNKKEELTAIDLDTEMAFAHNGIMTSFEILEEKDLSDTQIFVRDYLSLVQDEKDFTPLLRFAAEETNSKYILMTPTANLLVGNFLEEGGVYYSNSAFKKTYHSQYWERFGHSKYNYTSSTSRCGWCGEKADNKTSLKYDHLSKMYLCPGCWQYIDTGWHAYSPAKHCSVCNKATNVYIYHEDQYVCHTCYDKLKNTTVKLYKCKHCGEEYSHDQIQVIENEFVCDDCINESNCFLCENCNSLACFDDAHQLEDAIVCARCYQEAFCDEIKAEEIAV